MNNKILNQLEKINEQIDVRIDDREVLFEQRTERWQESEKGEEYEEKTNELMEVFDNLDMAIDSLKSFLDL